MGNAECVFEKKTCPVSDNGISQKACSRNREKKKVQMCKWTLLGCQGGVVWRSFSEASWNTPSKPLVILSAAL